MRHTKINQIKVRGSYRKKAVMLKNMKILKLVFYALITVFILILLIIFVIPILSLTSGFRREVLNIVFLPLAILFFLLGVILIFLTLKLKLKRKLKVFLLLTGISPMGFLISAILHNFLDVLGMKIISVVFFFIAILICPIIFLIGSIGSIILLRYKRKSARHPK